MVLMLFRTYKQEKPVKKFSQIIAMVTPLATLFFQLAIIKKGGIYWFLIVIALSGGLSFGRTWSKSTVLFFKEQKVFGRNTVWWLAFWGMSFIFVYAMNIWGKDNGLNIAIVVMSFTTGKAVGMSSGILQEMNALLAGEAVPGVPGKEFPSAHFFCENCGAAMTVEDSFCENCGIPGSVQPIITESESTSRQQEGLMFCEHCGAQMSSQDSFCEGCGERIQ